MICRLCSSVQVQQTSAEIVGLLRGYSGTTDDDEYDDDKDHPHVGRPARVNCDIRGLGSRAGKTDASPGAELSEMDRGEACQNMRRVRMRIEEMVDCSERRHIRSSKQKGTFHNYQNGFQPLKFENKGQNQKSELLLSTA